jgi:hypothetical protein
MDLMMDAITYVRGLVSAHHGCGIMQLRARAHHGCGIMQLLFVQGSCACAVCAAALRAPGPGGAWLPLTQAVQAMEEFISGFPLVGWNCVSAAATARVPLSVTQKMPTGVCGGAALCCQ